MTYLKNVILKLLETGIWHRLFPREREGVLKDIIHLLLCVGEVEALLPVVGMLLQFSPEEVFFALCLPCIFFSFSHVKTASLYLSLSLP